MHLALYPCILVLTAALAARSCSAFLIMAKLLTQSRLDPIVSPGIVSEHLHAVIGGSSFNKSYNAETYQNANCTTVEVSIDKSNYWQPSIYGQNPNGTYSPLPVAEIRVYYFMDNDTIAFPPGIRVRVGNPDSRTAAGNASEFTEFAQFSCQMGADNNGTNEGIMRGFPSYVCQDFIRASVTFPNCWNGKELDTPDHRSHMAFALWTQQCPDSHPVKVPQITTEFGYISKQYNATSLILSNGDTTGFGIHSDFAMGWDIDVLENAVRDPSCNGRQNVFGDGEQCAALLNYVDETSQCTMKSNIPQEPVGILGPVSQLPGCNLPWTNNASKPTCDPARVDPTIGPPTSFVDFSGGLIPVFNGTNTSGSGVPGPQYTSGARRMYATPFMIALAKWGRPGR